MSNEIPEMLRSVETSKIRGITEKPLLPKNLRQPLSSGLVRCRIFAALAQAKTPLTCGVGESTQLHSGSSNLRLRPYSLSGARRWTLTKRPFHRTCSIIRRGRSQRPTIFRWRPARRGSPTIPVRSGIPMNRRLSCRQLSRIAHDDAEN